jgi:putative uncharacterized protein (fragment)
VLFLFWGFVVRGSISNQNSSSVLVLLESILVPKIWWVGEKCDLRPNMSKNIKIFRKIPQMMAMKIAAMMRLVTVDSGYPSR